MTKKKLAYEAPKTESLVVRFEGMVCTSPTNEKMNSTTMGGSWSIDD